MKTLLSLLTKGLIVLFGIISIAAVAITLFKPEWIKIAIEWVGSLIETLGYWNFLIAFSSALIESLPVIGNFLPGMNIMILVGGFWGKSHLLVTIILAAM